MGRKLTQDEFVAKMKLMNPNILVLGEYVGSREKIRVKCMIDDYEWEATSSSMIDKNPDRRCGCPMCGGSLKLTHEIFLDRVSKINKDIIVIGRYINNRTKVSVKCKIDGYEWMAPAGTLMAGNGCPICAGIKKKTNEEFISQIKNTHPNVEVLSEYKTAKSKIKLRCKIDGYEWEAIAASLTKTNPSRCPMCFGNLKKTNSEFLSEMKIKNKDIKPMSEYVGANSSMRFKCLVDGYEWESTPHTVLSYSSTSGCPKCNNYILKTNDEFLDQLKNINRYIEPIDKYVAARKKIRFKCKLDGNVWRATPDKALRGRGCPVCKMSIGEKKIRDYLLDNNYDFETEYSPYWAEKRRYDFRIKNILIEFDGEQHFQSKLYFDIDSTLEHRMMVDKMKNDMALKNGYSLIRISFTEIENISKILDMELKSSVEPKLVTYGIEY